jgi:hypothetical protein
VLPQEGNHLEETRRELRQRAHSAEQSNALQAADLDKFEREVFGRDQSRFETVARSDEDALVAPIAQLAGDRQERNNVSAGPAARHHYGRHRKAGSLQHHCRVALRRHAS